MIFGASPATGLNNGKKKAISRKKRCVMRFKGSSVPEEFSKTMSTLLCGCRSSTWVDFLVVAVHS